MIKESMKKAQDKVKNYANKVRSFREFNVGDMVFFKVASKISQLKIWGKVINLFISISKLWEKLKF
jgi:hypothetical protein